MEHGRIIYLKITEIVIKFVFHLSENAEMYEVEDDIRQNYNIYFLKNKPQHTDFTVIFIWSREIAFLTQKKRKRIFIYFYEKRNNIFRTTLYISFNQFQLILREILQDYYFHKGGIILHSSACEIGGKIYLFTGDSGAGKSTVRKLLESRFRSLSDDFSIIKKEGNSYYYYQTPIAEKEGRTERSLRKWRIGKIFFLNKSSICRYKRINKKDQIFRLLLPQILVSSKGFSKIQMRFISDFVSLFDGFYDLYFTKDQKKIVKLFEET